jgi:uncharacterized protein YdaU (DUF1376 family)
VNYRWMATDAIDWLSSPTVLSMTAAQRGAYFHLLMVAWVDPDCSLPADHDILARIGGVSREEFALVATCFSPHPARPDRLHNPRQYQEWIEAGEREQARKDAASQAGRRSAEARKGRNQGDAGNAGSTGVQRALDACLTPVQQASNENQLHYITDTTTPCLREGAFTPESPLPPNGTLNGTPTAPSLTDSKGSDLPTAPQAVVVDIAENRSNSVKVGVSQVDTPEGEKVQPRASVREIDQPQGDFPAGWWRRACLLADMIETADSPEPVICPNGAARAMALCYAGETMKGELDQVEAVVRAICEHPKHERLSGILAGLRKYPDAPIPGNGSRPGRNSRLEQALAIITRERIVPMVNPTHRRKSA